MTQIVLAAMLAGFLAVSPTDGLEISRRKHPRQSDSTDVRGGVRIRVPAAARCVLILDHPFEPRYAYIRVDNAVYPLCVHDEIIAPAP